MKINLYKNESPYLPDEKILRATEKGIKKINRYSELKYIDELKILLGKYNNNFPPDKIILSHGSDLLIREIINVFSKDRKIITVNPSFFPISQFALNQSRELVRIQLSLPNFDLNSQILLNEIKEPSLIVIDNPNNPTGNILLNEDVVGKILKNENILLVVDEAYFEFSGQTFAGMIKKYPNLAIIRTMDKAFSLAGLRLGYLLMGEFFENHFSDFPQYLSTPTIYAAIETLKNIEISKKNILQLLKEKKRVAEQLQNKGFNVFLSSTNFLLIKSKIPDFAQKLFDKNIQIYDLSTFWLNDFYRITIDSPNENDILLNAVSEIINKK